MRNIRRLRINWSADALCISTPAVLRFYGASHVNMVPPMLPTALLSPLSPLLLRPLISSAVTDQAGVQLLWVSGVCTAVGLTVDTNPASQMVG